MSLKIVLVVAAVCVGAYGWRNTGSQPYPGWQTTVSQPFPSVQWNTGYPYDYRYQMTPEMREQAWREYLQWKQNYVSDMRSRMEQVRKHYHDKMVSWHQQHEVQTPVEDVAAPSDLTAMSVEELKVELFKRLALLDENFDKTVKDAAAAGGITTEEVLAPYRETLAKLEEYKAALKTATTREKMMDLRMKYAPSILGTQRKIAAEYNVKSHE